LEKPSWLKVKPPTSENYLYLKKMMHELGINSVCQEAICPNIDECWKNKTATFMIMGSVCTRGCRFCAVKTGDPSGILDHLEPTKIAEAISTLKLKYVVLTSVDRDDLDDGGSEHFAKTVSAIKIKDKNIVVEILAPDFGANRLMINKVINSGPEVYGHNIETVERVTPLIRDRRSTYKTSMKTLETIKLIKNNQYTKSSLLLGVGETKDEVISTLKDLRNVGCDIVTLGQYLSPTKRHYPVTRYIHPDEFQEYNEIATSLGFKFCASGPLVRSSYRAGELFRNGQNDNRELGTN